MILGIYLVGFILGYILTRYVELKEDNPNNWESVLRAILYGMFSWVTVFLIGFFSLILWIDRIELFKKKPPKWL